MLSHLALLVLYAFLVGVFFAFLWRHERRARLRLFLQIFLSMVVGALLVAWLMYAVPSGPPVPFPTDDAPTADRPAADPRP